METEREREIVGFMQGFLRGMGNSLSERIRSIPAEMEVLKNELICDIIGIDGVLRLLKEPIGDPKTLPVRLHETVRALCDEMDAAFESGDGS